MDRNKSIVKYIIKNGIKIDYFEKFSMDKQLSYMKLRHPNYWNNHNNFLEIYMMINCEDRCIGTYNNLLNKKENKPDLHMAVIMKNEKKILFLLDSGVDVNSKDEIDNTPLHLLFNDLHKNENTYKIAKLLIDKGKSKL